MNPMKAAIIFGGVLGLAMGAISQETVPAGTILPVRLNISISLKTPPGKVITGRIMQNVWLPNGMKIRDGAKISGHVTEVRPAENRAGPRIGFRFDAVEVSKRMIPIRANLRALASFMEVDEAQIPVMGPDRGTPETAWTTRQIGGDVVFRGGGPVKEGGLLVGKPVYDGVLGFTYSSAAGKCRGVVQGNNRPQALWLFSADACGIYGMPHVKIAHAGRSDPMGEIMLNSNRPNLKIPSGSGMLLRVIGADDAKDDASGSHASAGNINLRPLGQ